MQYRILVTDPRPEEDDVSFDAQSLLYILVIWVLEMTWNPLYFTVRFSINHQ